MKHLLPRLAEPGTHPLQTQDIRREIAAVAARFVAEDGATYAIAKQKAAQHVLGSAKFSHDFLPDNAELEDQVRAYHQLFFADTQPRRLLHLRKIALAVMRELTQFNPHLTGSVLNGTAGEHDEIVLHLFVDNSKEVAIYLLNQNIQFDVSDSSRPADKEANRREEPLETLCFVHSKEGVHLVLFALDDMRRMSVKKSPRANIDALQKIISESEHHEI